jgi:superfamily II DNA or RNA helicase/PIN domain nuclease of toxin-antitoxin system
MSELVLRPYQQSCERQVLALWERGVNRVIVVLPTGGGKTELAKSLSINGGFKNPIALAHTRSLVDQLQRRLGFPAMTIQALRKRQLSGAGWPYGEPDLVVWDEIHHGDSQDWQGLFEMIHRDCKVLGPTATPWRFSHGSQRKITKEVGEGGVRVGGAKNNKHGKGLGDLFEAMIVGVTPKQLVRDGYLVPLVTMNLVEAQDAAASLTGKPGPSYDEKKGKNVGRITAGSDVRLDPVDAWFRHGENRKAMVFCHLIPAAERAAARFVERGIAASVVHGKLDARETDKRLAAFARGELHVLCNVMQLTEGYDCPDVQCLVIDRGCNNLNTYVQVCGRGARAAPGKTDCLILDLTGCTEEHGHPQKDQDYWVVTSEGRAVSDLACEVCGTRLSPMFPTRCMRCDPFRPKLGDPKELLDTGMRVYAALKDLRDSEGWNDLPEDERDQLVISELSPFETATEQEQAVRDLEVERARKRIKDREEAAHAAIQAEIAAKARAEQAERDRIANEALEKARQERMQAWREQQVESERLAREKWAAEAKLFAEKQRTIIAAREKPLEPKDHQEALDKLTSAFQYAIRSKRNLGVAIRDVRNRLKPYQSVYNAQQYDVPESLKAALREVNASWDSSYSGLPSPAQYELDRMMGDYRTNKYGVQWCKKKVAEMFGAGCLDVKSAAAAPVDRAALLDDVPF